MNKIELTLIIESKGYDLDEFLNHIGFSLRWYREHSKPGAKRYDFLAAKVDEFIKKGDYHFYANLSDRIS